MSRLRNAWNALVGNTPPAATVVEPVAEVPAAPSAEHNLTGLVGRDALQEITPYRNVRRDRVIENTVAPPGARQQWQLHRVREESRNLYFTSPMWQSYIYATRIQVRGYRPSRLVFNRATREQKVRLKEVFDHLKREWTRYQLIPGVGGTGRSLHQMAGSALYHLNVDGDCFLTWRRRNGMRVWDLHPGDSLAEQDHMYDLPRGNALQLGVETDPYGYPHKYYFGAGGQISRLNFGYWSYGSAGTDVVEVPAALVRHIRDLSTEITAVRGWPRCTAVIDEIARLDEWYSALVRSAIVRASIAIALEKDMMLGNPDAVLGNRGGLARAAKAARNIGTESDFDQAGISDPIVKKYQQFESAAGGVFELEAGYKPHQISTGAPTSQEATSMAMMERRVCATLGTTPATLLGDYAALSFSNVQGLHLREKDSVDDRQMMLTDQYHRPTHLGWMRDRLVNLVRKFPVIVTGDFDCLLYPDFVLNAYRVIDKQRLIKPLLDTFDRGILTWSELRDELGYIASDPETVIEEWKENRRMLGLPETPTQNVGPDPGASSDSDNGSDDDEEDDDG